MTETIKGLRVEKFKGLGKWLTERGIMSETIIRLKVEKFRGLAKVKGR
jgi:hypothetical protein